MKIEIKVKIIVSYLKTLATQFDTWNLNLCVVLHFFFLCRLLNYSTNCLKKEGKKKLKKLLICQYLDMNICFISKR